ncbi:hypothetical protein C0J52_18560, partial [Blattella germanica]
FAWVTLATNDSYSLGALVLAHSLRRAGTPHDLVALVTPGVSQTMRNQLSTIFTLVQEVNVLDSKDEANLALLERPDLGITFTKLHCWRLTQYEKCVFLDADTLVLKNSDELFEREELSAAPDPGWPDCFNSGVFVYRPSQDTFNAIIKFALTKGSFDGGDQGLLNMFFSDWATKDISKHLPFIYNMVSTATYSYLPAYKQFGESAKIVHFIGANKPWLQYFDSESKVARSPSGSEHMQPLLQLWWDIFCSTVHPSLSPDMEQDARGESHDHNHHPDPSSTSQANSNINSQYVKVANETECSVDELSMEDDPSRTADDGLGLAGALAQLTLGVPRTAEQTAFEEHMRRQAWEQGNMDYMGRDSFDNIWRKITETLAEAPTKPATEEVPPTQPASEPKLPESKPPAPKSRKSPPADTSEVPGLSSSVEPTTNQISQVTETPLEGKSIEPSPLASSDIPPPKSASESAKPMPLAPHTPSIIEATPPTSPPIGIPSAPLADIQALKVEATPPETPPVGSSLSEQLKTTQTTESHEQTLSISKDLNIQQSSPAPECPNKKPPPVEKKEQSDRLEQVETFSQEVPALKEITSSLVSTPTEVPASLLEKETPAASSVSQIPSTQETSVLGDVPLPKDEVTVETTGQTDSSISPIPKDEVTVKTTGQTDSSIPPSVHKTEISISQSTDAKNVPSPCVVEVKLPAEQIVPISQLTDEVKVPSSGTADAQPAIGKDVPVEQISSAITEVKPVLDVTVSQQVGEPQIPTEVKSPADKDVVSQNVVEPLSQASPLPGVKPTIEKEVPVAQQAETPTLPSSVTEVPVENVIPNSQQIAEKQIPTSNVTQVKSSLEEVVQIPQQVTDPQIPASAAVEVKPSEKEVSVSPSGEIGSSPVSSPTSNNETQVSKSQTNEKSVPEDSNAQTASAPVVKTKEETVKPAGKKPSVELKTASVESTQSAQVPKSPPSKPSAPVSTPSTPDVPPSDQAPIPPKRRGHKSGGTAAASEQGAASKPATQPQAQQSKGSKGHKGKK